MPMFFQVIAVIIIFMLFMNSLTDQFSSKYRKEMTDEQIQNSLVILLFTGWWLTSVIVSLIVSWSYKTPS